MTPTPEQQSRMRIQYALVRADRHWATQHLSNALPPDRMEMIVRAVEKAVGTTGVLELELELAKTRGCLARLVEAVAGAWQPDVDAGAQAHDAMQIVRRVEAYLVSLQDDREVA